MSRRAEMAACRAADDLVMLLELQRQVTTDPGSDALQP